MRSVCVYCGSSVGTGPAYREKASALGRMLAERGYELVYGGAVMGLMGAVSRACLESGGRVTGVIPEHLIAMGTANTGCTELIPVKDMHERKLTMFERSDGFIAMPGGPGTLEEAFEILSWMQLGIHGKPLAFYDIDGYYGGLMDQLRTMTDRGFMRREHLDYCFVSGDAGAILDRLEGYVHAPHDKWENRDIHRIE